MRKGMTKLGFLGYLATMSVGMVSLCYVAGCVDESIRKDAPKHPKTTLDVKLVSDTGVAWNGPYFQICEIRGHEYLICQVYKGCGITHLESCPCKKPRQ